MIYEVLRMMIIEGLKGCFVGRKIRSIAILSV